MQGSITRFNDVATLASIRHLRDRLNMTLIRTQIAREYQEDLLLAMSEIATNIIRHAQPSASQILVELVEADTQWVLHIFDDGGTFAGFHQQVQQLIKQNRLSDSETGLGLVLSLFPQCQYTTRSIANESMNCFSLQLPIPNEQFKQPRIALIESDVAVSRLVAEYLAADYQVLPFSHVATAIGVLRFAAVDLVMIAMNCQDMDGFELRDQLTIHANLGTVPIIFLTDEDDFDSQYLNYRLPSDNYLRRPFTKGALLSVVQQTLCRIAPTPLMLDHALWEVQSILPAKLGELRLTVRTRLVAANGGDFVCHLMKTDAPLLVIGAVIDHNESNANVARISHHRYLHRLIATLPSPVGPAACLSALSQALTDNAIFDQVIVTCLVVQILENGLIRLASAGYPPPLMVDMNGRSFHYLDIDGTLPGLLTDAQYHEHTLQLGDHRMMLYSDGLFSAQRTVSERDQLEQHIQNTLIGSVHQPLPCAADQVMQVFDTMTAMRPLDDATLILLESNNRKVA